MDGLLEVKGNEFPGSDNVEATTWKWQGESDIVEASTWK